MGKKLIVYHSYTGNTKSIAESIQKSLNCDILELKPKNPFSEDYREKRLVTSLDEIDNWINSLK